MIFRGNLQEPLLRNAVSSLDVEYDVEEKLTPVQNLVVQRRLLRTAIRTLQDILPEARAEEEKRERRKATYLKRGCQAVHGLFAAGFATGAIRFSIRLNNIDQQQNLVKNEVIANCK